MTNKLAFVFGAGSSRGALQVGALEVLLEAGIFPDMVVGSSVGALNAAYFANDPTMDGVKTLKRIYHETEFTDIFAGGNFQAILNLIRKQPSLFNNGAMRQLIQSHLTVTKFNELQIPCYITATDIDTAELYVFGDDGQEEVIDSLMSSAAVMPIQPPYKVGEHVLGDGGMKAMLPVEAALERGATEIYAFNLACQLRTANERNSAVDMFLHVIDLLTYTQVEQTMRCATTCFPHVPIHRVDLFGESYVSFEETSKADELIETGYRQMKDYLEKEKKPYGYQNKDTSEDTIKKRPAYQNQQYSYPP